MNLILITFLAAIVAAPAQGTAVSEANHAAGFQEVPATLCDLVAHPDDYVGKPLLVKATLASGMEFSIFTDDTCQPALEKGKLIMAAFAEYHPESPLAKRLARLLKKNQRALVTVRAVFSDPGRNIGHQNCCRYKLEVQDLLAIQEIKRRDKPDKKPGTDGGVGWELAPRGVP